MQHSRMPLRVTLLVAGAFFMENLDGTIIATALPQMARSFHVGAVNLNIGMTAYLLTLAVFIPVSGWVADRLGSRSVFASAVSIFTIASVLCAAAQTLTQFTLLRILQGIGGAMMVPVGRLIVLRATPKDQLTQVMAWITWPGLAALVLGPPLGGFITTYASWHWIFLLNLPLGIAALILTTLWVQNINIDERHPFDWSTFLLAGFATTGGVYAMEKLGGDDINWHRPVAMLIAAIISGILAIVSARRKPTTSLIDLESMKLRTYRLSILGASAFRLSVSVLPFLLPLMFQIAFNLNAFTSGLYLLALFAGDLSMKTFCIPILRRFGFRNIIIVNGVISAVSIALCATFSPATPIAIIIAILFFHGAARSMEFTCMTTLAYTEIAPANMSRANGFLSAMIQLSVGTGVAIGAITLRLVAHANGHSASQPQLRDFHAAILIMAILALAPTLEAIGLHPTAGATASGHQPTQPEANPIG